MSTFPVEIKLLENNALIPTKAYPDDAGYDLYTSREAVIPPGSFQDVHTGIAIGMPPGVWARITGRSSTLRKYGLLVNEGIIDTGYRGELFVGCFNLTNREVVIPVGTRIAQLIFHNSVDVTWMPRLVLSESRRGESGFGSSGR